MGTAANFVKVEEPDEDEDDLLDEEEEADLDEENDDQDEEDQEDGEPRRTIGNSPAVHRIATGTGQIAIRQGRWIVAVDKAKPQKKATEETDEAPAQRKRAPGRKGPAKKGAGKKPAAARKVPTKKPAAPSAETKAPGSQEKEMGRFSTFVWRAAVTVGVGATLVNASQEMPQIVMPAVSGTWLYLAWKWGEKVDKPPKAEEETIPEAEAPDAVQAPLPGRYGPAAAPGRYGPAAVPARPTEPPWTPEKVNEGFMRILDDALMGRGGFANLGQPGTAIHIAEILDMMHRIGLTGWTFEELRRWYQRAGITVRDQAWDGRQTDPKLRNRPGIHRDDICHISRFKHLEPPKRKTSKVTTAR